MNPEGGKKHTKPKLDALSLFFFLAELLQMIY